MMANGGLRSLQFINKRTCAYFLAGVTGNEGKKLQPNGVAQCGKDLGQRCGIVVGER